SFLARVVRESSGRHGVHSRAFVSRHLRSRLSRGSADRGTAAPLPAGGGRQGPLVLSAPVAHAGFLAVPDGVDGPRPDDGDLPGALYALSRASRPGASVRSQSVVLSGR